MKKIKYIPVYIDGQPYTTCLPTGGSSSYDTTNMWDTMLDLLYAEDSLMHIGIGSLCQETPDRDDTSLLRIYRGAYFERGLRERLSAYSRYYDIGYRPVLIPLDPKTFHRNPECIHHMQDGQLVKFGTLYMNGNALKLPKDPFNDGDIPPYTIDAELHIGDSDPDPEKQIQWVKFGDFLISDRNLLCYISWDDLNKQNLVFCRERVPRTLSL